MRDAGYLPEAVRNYLALLGWGAGDDQTLLSTEELIERFTLERVSRNPARFDEVKLRWLNGLYIRKLPARRAHAVAWKPSPDARASPMRCGSARRRSPRSPTSGRWRGRCSMARSDDPKARERWLGEAGRAALVDVRVALAASPSFDEASVGEALAGVLERRAAKPREVYQPLRVAISGGTVSPGIFESVALLGREETLRRIDVALAA